MDARPTVNGRPIDPDVETELDRLGSMPIATLRIRYNPVDILLIDRPITFAGRCPEFDGCVQARQAAAAN